MFRLIPRKKNSQYQVFESINRKYEHCIIAIWITSKSHRQKKHLRKNVALELETLARVFDAHITHTEKESYHEYLRSATNFITKNAYSNIDNTYKSLSNLINNKNIIILAVDKENYTVIHYRTDYQNKDNSMINECILEGKYIETLDNTYKDLKCFQDYIYRNLNKH